MQVHKRDERPAFWDSEETIADVPKGRDIVRVKRVTKNGRTLIDVREHYLSSYNPDPDAWLPSKKGFTIPLEMGEMLGNAIKKSAEQS